ncbi:MAG: hypothetical protein D6795_13470 [Deltaproteobacteria bacterium]|nr:MAG: hypothetical protein D6795_13470 [Deltaproteobacteria bacterium]
MQNRQQISKMSSGISVREEGEGSRSVPLRIEERPAAEEDRKAEAHRSEPRRIHTVDPERVRERDVLEIFELTRKADRIRSSDVLERAFPAAKRLHSPDPALLVARGTFRGREILFLGQEKPKGTSYEEAARVNFGMMSPAGYRYVVQLLEEAERNGWPVVTLIDTPGADPSEHSAMQLQSWRISESIGKFCTVRTPTISIVLGEGGSGGALALQVTDRRFMMENALYSVIAPESCGSILFRDNTKIRESLDLLKPTADYMKQYGIIDAILPEPPGGADRENPETFRTIEGAVMAALDELLDREIDELLEARYQQVRHLGRFSCESSPLRLLRKLTLDRNLSKLRVGTPLSIDDLSENDPTDGIKYGYLIRKLAEEGRDDLQVIVCAKDKGGCGAYLSVEEFFDNFKSCPYCGLGEKLSVHEWARCLLDSDTFYELDPKLSVEDLCDAFPLSEGYAATLQRAQSRSGYPEALVTGHGAIQGMEVVVAISNFDFIGGSMGTVVGEKFARAVEYAVEHRLPLISLCCSGGARMQEGTLSLMQMAKTNMALTRLEREKLLFISVIANPTTGGSLASYVTRGDIVISEPKALVAFAGPRVVALSGIHVPDHVTRAEFLQKQGGIHEICGRREMHRTLAKYVGLYYKYRS